MCYRWLLQPLSACPLVSKPTTTPLLSRSGQHLDRYECRPCRGQARRGQSHRGQARRGQARRDKHVFRTAGKQREDVVSRRNLCGLDHGQVVDPAEPGSHWRPESSCAEAHPVAESGPQVLQVTRCHQSLHLSPGAGVLQDQTKTADVNQWEGSKCRQLRAEGSHSLQVLQRKLGQF